MIQKSNPSTVESRASTAPTIAPLQLSIPYMSVHSAGLQLKLFGFPQVALDGQPLAFARRGSLALLAYLALTERTYSRESIIALLAANNDEQRGRIMLRNVLADLNNQLSQHLIVTRQTLALNQQRTVTTDVGRFEVALVLAERGDVRPLAASVVTFKQELLEGFTLRDSSLFDEWLLLERERLNVLHLEALTILSTHALRSGDSTAGLFYARRLLSLDPWREDAHRQVMLLLARDGHRGAALTQYEQCRQLLVDTFGVAPVSQTTALADQIRSGATLAWPPGLEHTATRYRELNGDNW